MDRHTGKNPFEVRVLGPIVPPPPALDVGVDTESGAIRAFAVLV